jgi:hypothetical protein
MTHFVLAKLVPSHGLFEQRLVENKNDLYHLPQAVLM